MNICAFLNSFFRIDFNNKTCKMLFDLYEQCLKTQTVFYEHFLLKEEKG